MNASRKYGLQLFADPVMNTTTSATEGNNLSPEMKEFYNTQLIRTAEPKLRYKKFANKVPMPRNNGKVVSWRRWSNFPKTTTPLTEGVTPAGVRLDVAELTAEVTQHGKFSMITDMLELTAIDNVIMEMTQQHASNAAIELDTCCRDELMTGTNVVFAPKSDGTETSSREEITSDCLLTPKIVARVAAKLKANNAPTIDGHYVSIIHPYVAYDLMRNPEWQEAHKYENSVDIFDGEVGRMYGVRFVESSEAKIWKDGDTAVFGSVFFGEGAYGDVDLDGGNLQIIVKQKGSAGTADPLDQRSTVGWKATACTKILIPEYLYRVESGSDFSATAEAN